MCLVTQLSPTLCDPMDCSPPGFTVHGDSPGKNPAVGYYALLQGGLPNPGIEPRSPTLQVDSLPSEPSGKPQNTAVGSLSLLQGIFPTQESNRILLHCRQILGLPGKPIQCNHIINPRLTENKEELSRKGILEADFKGSQGSRLFCGQKEKRMGQ